MTKKTLDELKQEYKEIQAKYDLPSFEEFNEDFCVERATEIEVDLLLREFRKFMADKVSNYTRYFETLLNPANASMFVFSFIKTLSPEDKKIIEDLYKKLAMIELKLMELDIKYVEEKEANFIKEVFIEWQEVKVDWMKILDAVKKNWNNKAEKNNGKGYFG